MFKGSIAAKTLSIIGVTLALGFGSLLLLTLWLQTTSTLRLQDNNDLNIASLLATDVEELMMKGDSKEVDKYISAARKNSFLKDVKIYGAEGKESDAGPTAAVNPLVAVALKSGTNAKSKNNVGGERTLSIVMPLKNEARCEVAMILGQSILGQFPSLHL